MTSLDIPAAHRNNRKGDVIVKFTNRKWAEGVLKNRANFKDGQYRNYRKITLPHDMSPMDLKILVPPLEIAILQNSKILIICVIIKPGIGLGNQHQQTFPHSRVCSGKSKRKCSAE